MRKVSVAIVTIVLVVSSIGMIGLVAADDDVNITEDEISEESSDVVAQLDSNIRVTGYSYSADREVFTVDLEHHGDDRGSVSVTITEVISPDSGESGSFGIETVRIAPGESISAEVTAENPAVMITSPESLEDGSGVFLSDPEPPGPVISAFEGEAGTWGMARLAGIGGAVGSVISGGLVAWYVKSGGNSKVRLLQ